MGTKRNGKRRVRKRRAQTRTSLKLWREKAASIHTKRVVALEVGDEQIHIEYIPRTAYENYDKLKPSFDASPSETEKMGVIIEWLASVIIRWDIEDDNGKPLPINTETINELPLTLLVEIAQEIIDDLK